MNDLISTPSRLSWDEYFMLQALIASYKSKDPNTKVGCVFVDDRNHQIAGIDENQTPWGNNKTLPLDQQKYGYVVHSEANALLHAKTSLENSRVYVTLFPCHECAKMLATVKIKEVIFLSDKYGGTVENTIAKKIFDLSGIKFRKLQIPKNLVDDLQGYLLRMLND
jgi:dCMP deaminase